MHQKETKKILFLYTELAGYFLSCIKKLHEKYSLEIHIVRYKVNKEAPFDFKFSDTITVYDESNFDVDQLLALAQKIGPDIVYCSGWINKKYLKVCKCLKGEMPTIVGFDNHWKGTLKQHIASLFSKYSIRNYFSHCWIPGEPQMKFAHKLGFTNDNILTGFYSANTDLFLSNYEMYKEHKLKRIEKRFIYVGRYYDFKGIKTLWDAFVALQDEQPNEWELWCLGVGNITPINHSKIKHFGFVQPEQMSEYIKNTDVFVLPSLVEPWGVVVHEFAAAGFPLLCSNKVGAAHLFVNEGDNGFVFEAGNDSDLKSLLKKVVNLPKQELVKMGEESNKMAQKLTLEKWTDTLMQLLDRK